MEFGIRDLQESFRRNAYGFFLLSPEKDYCILTIDPAPFSRPNQQNVIPVMQHVEISASVVLKFAWHVCKTELKNQLFTFVRLINDPRSGDVCAFLCPPRVNHLTEIFLKLVGKGLGDREVQKSLLTFSMQIEKYQRTETLTGQLREVTPEKSTPQKNPQSPQRTMPENILYEKAIQMAPMTRQNWSRFLNAKQDQWRQYVSELPDEEFLNIMASSSALHHEATVASGSVVIEDTRISSDLAAYQRNVHLPGNGAYAMATRNHGLFMQALYEREYYRALFNRAGKKMRLPDPHSFKGQMKRTGEVYEGRAPNTWLKMVHGMSRGTVEPFSGWSGREGLVNCISEITPDFRRPHRRVNLKIKGLNPEKVRHLSACSSQFISSALAPTAIRAKRIRDWRRNIIPAVLMRMTGLEVAADYSKMIDYLSVCNIDVARTINADCEQRRRLRPWMVINQAVGAKSHADGGRQNQEHSNQRPINPVDYSHTFWYPYYLGVSLMDGGGLQPLSTPEQQASQQGEGILNQMSVIVSGERVPCELQEFYKSSVVGPQAVCYSLEQVAMLEKSKAIETTYNKNVWTSDLWMSVRQAKTEYGASNQQNEFMKTVLRMRTDGRQFGTKEIRTEMREATLPERKKWDLVVTPSTVKRLHLGLTLVDETHT